MLDVSTTLLGRITESTPMKNVKTDITKKLATAVRKNIPPFLDASDQRKRNPSKKDRPCCLMENSYIVTIITGANRIVSTDLAAASGMNALSAYLANRHKIIEQKTARQIEKIV